MIAYRYTLSILSYLSPLIPPMSISLWHNAIRFRFDRVSENANELRCYYVIIRKSYILVLSVMKIKNTKAVE